MKHLLLTLLFLMPLTAQAEEKETYTPRIGFTKKDVVGDKYQFTSTMTDTNKTEVNVKKKVTKTIDTDITYILKGEFKVTHIEKGKMTRGEFKISEFSKDIKDSLKIYLIEKGTILLPTIKDGKLSYTIKKNKRSISLDKENKFKELFDYALFSGSDNSSIKSTKPLSVGDKVDMDKDFAEGSDKEDKSIEMDFDATDIDVKITKLVDLEKTKCIVIDAHVHIKKMKTDKPGVKIKTGVAIIDVKWTVPADAKDNSVIKKETTMKMGMEVMMAKTDTDVVVEATQKKTIIIKKI